MEHTPEKRGTPGISLGGEKKVFIVTNLNGGYQVRHYVLLLDVMDFERGGSFLLGAKNGRGCLKNEGEEKKSHTAPFFFL